MWRAMLQGWVDLILGIILFLPKLLGKSTIVLISAVVTYAMLTGGFHG